MKMTKLVLAGCGIILLVALFVVWYSIAANYDCGALAGTYVFHVPKMVLPRIYIKAKYCD